MKILRAAVLLGILTALLAPEARRYAAERRLGFATSAFRVLLARSGDAETAQNIMGIGEIALSTTTRLPGDPRPWILGGSSFLITGRPDRALEEYREALSTGERAEIDLNLGRAYSLLERPQSAEAAYVRAGWISPEILESLPAGVRGPIRARIGDLAWKLSEGRLEAPPPLPEEERR